MLSINSRVRKSDAKLKAGIFVSPEIRKLMLNEEFDSRLNPVELAAWNALKSVVANFLGNHRHEQYADMVDDMLKAHEQLGARMSLKVHFLHSHLDFFPPNLSKVSDEQGERFHQDISVIEGRYQDRFDANIMGDFCWYLQYNVKAKARHIKEKPNALNISKAISQVIVGNKLHLLSVAVVSLLRHEKF